MLFKTFDNRGRPVKPAQEGISAILIVYHEEKIIERCLLSLADVVDEIIIVHDGECQDKTLEIAGKYTDKIFIEPHRGEAEFHKSAALEKTSYSWILKIDADEFLSEALRSNLRSLTCDERYDAYAFIWPIWNGSRYISKDLPYKEALFRKDKIYSADFPHKNIFTNGSLKEVPLLLEHRPKYNNYTLKIFRNKWLKWIQVQAAWTVGHNNIRFYHYSPNQIEAYNRYMQNQIHFAHPVLAPAWFLLSFFRFIQKLKIWKNLQLVHVAFLQGLYAAWLCYYIWVEKKNRPGPK